MIIQAIIGIQIVLTMDPLQVVVQDTEPHRR